MIDRHSETAIAINRDAPFRPDEIADDNEWCGVGIGPVGQTRDSEALDRSNFQTISEDLQERYPDEIEIMRFGHWACGWIEEIAYNVGNADLRNAVQAWRDKLDNYPVANEEHYSELEYDELQDYLATELASREFPAGVEIQAVVTEIMDGGCPSRPDDIDAGMIDAAIADVQENLRREAATPPTDQLQILPDYGRPTAGC